MADKTTTLKTKTNDNVYPNVIGECRKDSFADSSTITHHFYDQTHKVGFQIANETNIKIQNSLQKPAGLTKTKLVGVGANGQENIEIGDNLTLANGKLSASGGGGSSDINVLQLNDDEESYSGTLDINKLNVLKAPYGNAPVVVINDHSTYGYFIGFSIQGNEGLILNFEMLGDGHLRRDSYALQLLNYSHFITMTNSDNNIALYLTIQNSDKTEFTAETLARYLADKKVLANGNLHGAVPTYIEGAYGIIRVHYMNPGDSNINPTPDEYQDLSSFTITDLATPVI